MNDLFVMEYGKVTLKDVLIGIGIAVGFVALGFATLAFWVWWYGGSR